MRYRMALAIVGISLGSCGSALGAETVREAPEIALRRAVGLTETTKIKYFDTHLHRITAVQFQSAFASGSSLMLSRNGNKNELWVFLVESHEKQLSITTLPTLDLVDLAGHPVRNTDLLGHPSLVSFFFADCAPCIQEIPTLNAFAAKHPEITTIAITLRVDRA